MPGKPLDKLKYLKGLDEKNFPYLIGDILNIHYNHSSVKIVDGTGDGKRDIFSIDPLGNSVITQCKFHYDFTKTSGSSETDELIIALNKFSYNNGFFCTSGKLSPQSKREYLDNYKNFTLNWLEGHEIVDIVLENTILKRIWFEGEKIHLINNQICIPFILRKLPEDINFEFSFLKDSFSNNQINLKIKEHHYINPRQLYPLNNLSVKKAKNTFGNYALGYLAILSGNTSLNLIKDTKQKILNEINNNIHFEDSYIAVRFGIPYHLEIGDNHMVFKDERFYLPISCETFILYKNKILNEYDFLINVSSHWKLPERISISQLDNFCYYNNDQDITFYLEYYSKAEKDLNPHIEVQLEIEKIIWSKSIFIIVNNDSEVIFELSPDLSYKYGSNEKLLCWIYPSPLMYSADINEFENFLVDKNFENLKITLTNIALQNKLQVIDWKMASRIATLNEDNPFPENPQISYRMIDIFEEFNKISSPIKPDNRIFNFECVFRVCERDYNLLSTNIKSLETLLKKNYNSNDFKFEFDDDTNYFIFLRILQTPSYDANISTFENLEILTKVVNDINNETEKIIKSFFPQAIRYTKKYWLEELGIFL